MTTTGHPAAQPVVDSRRAGLGGVAAPALRFAPAAAAFLLVAGTLLATGTPALDIARYTAYALLAVVLPGTLVYRALRRRPHTLVEDLAIGAAVGLVLELAAWALFVAAGLEHWLWLWPTAVVVPFVAVPALRTHWRPTGYTRVPTGWAWSVAAVVAGFTTYLAESFLLRNPILPVDEQQAQYIDLAFQLSIAGAATHQVPLDVPQVAGEPLHYHWFGFAHMGAASLVSGVDLPTVFFRLAVPALCALAVVLVAVVGWRISGRAYAGVAAAALMFTVGEFGFENGVRQLFGTQATFIVWGSPSMTYSWVLLLPLIAALGDILRRSTDGGVPPTGGHAPPLGRGAWVLAALFLAGSTGAKASSIPVVAGALGLTALVLLAVRRRLVWPVLGVTALALVAQAFATAVLFAFESHGVTLDPLSGLRPYVGAADRSPLADAVLWTGVFVAFALNLQLRLAGIVALAWRRCGRLEPVQVFLLVGALVGPMIYLVVGHPGSSNQYFTRSGFPFGVLLSAWGYAEVLERARLSRRAGAALGAFALTLAVGFTAIQLRYPATVTTPPAYDPVLPLLLWASALSVLAAVGWLAWAALGDRWPGLRGRGGAVLLTAVLVAGAPGLVMDAAAAHKYPNGGAYAVVSMPQSRVAAARWVHDHSKPDDVLATNVHCQAVVNGWCDSRTFWLSAYAERAVLIEGWAFAPRMVGKAGGPYAPFWDPALFQANEAAFATPTPAGLDALRDGHGVRWLVVDREVAPESPELARLADVRYDNGRVAVYELRD